MHWDLYCRVVDNYGDIGVCWRLATDLASRGDHVRLWTDDASALAWMAPEGAPGVQVRPWPAHAGQVQPQTGSGAADPPADVVIEAFGCVLPPPVVAAMAAQAAGGRAPVWINLEYLSAEDYVERSHGLPSPQADGPGRGLTKWFFYPGFTVGTGGLLREPHLAPRQAQFDARAWQRAHGIAPAAGERCVSLFCYDNPALPALLDALSAAPTLLLATAGHAVRQVQALLGPGGRRGALRAQLVPTLSQRDYDHLLWSCDANLVRGEDSFVRAQWAGKPFLWQVYPQDDGVHALKLRAFERRFLAGAAPEAAAAVTQAELVWNGLATPGPQGDVLPRTALWPAWQAQCAVWRDRLLALPDLTSSLRAFVLEHR
ncbi:MAG: elongation factor P maturation arginine rhamnosyltransferase EarP [Betaproteobacteria bacterium]